MAFLAAAVLCAGAAAPLASAQSAGDHVEVGDLRLEALPAQDLIAGHCSLFLWSRSERPVFILFATDNPGRATVRTQGRTRTLERRTGAGERTFGQYRTQSFSGSGVAFDVELEFDADRPVQDGAVIKTGMLRTRTRDGSEAMLPVGGMVACKAA
jgi:hypothetical protein